MLIEVKVKVARIIDGKTRKRTETYILDKEFFAQAEYEVTNYLTEEQNQGIVSSAEIISLRQSQIKEIDELWDNSVPSFIVTLKDLFHDDEGNEKQLRYKVLLFCSNLTEANRRAHELSHQGYDMQIEGIKQVDYEYLNSNITEEEISND